jgi:hypothetical protein
MKAVRVLALAAVLMAGTAEAHHSHAMYDTTKPVVLKGVVKSFAWTNPHAWLTIVVTDAAGQTQEWAFEMGATPSLAQEGWRPRSVAPGDVVSVAFHPLKENLRVLSEGRNVGALAGITLPDGRHLGDAGAFGTQAVGSGQ